MSSLQQMTLTTNSVRLFSNLHDFLFLSFAKLFHTFDFFVGQLLDFFQ